MSKVLWRGQLFVNPIDADAKYKDVVRVSQSNFLDPVSQRPVLEKNKIYRLSVSGRSILVALRGSYKPGIYMDAFTRERLTIKPKQSHHFEFSPAGPFGQFLWAWGATDPAYRIATRLGALSLFLGALGAVLGVWSIYLSLK